MESFIKYVLGEMRVIAEAPVVFITALLVLGMTLYWVMDWRYAAILSNRDSEIALLKSQRDDYKDKLGGASPDQARARIDALEKRVAELEPKLARLAPRRITPEQRAAFIRALNVNAGTALVWNESSCGDCAQYSEDFISMISAVPGWQVGLGTAMGNPRRAPTGLGVLILDPSKPTAQATAVMWALRQARIPFDVLPTHPPLPGRQVDVELQVNLKPQ